MFRSIRNLWPACALLSLSPAIAAGVTIGEEGATYRIDPATLSVEYLGADRRLSISAPVSTPHEVTGLASSASTASWRLPEEGLTISCVVTAEGAFELTASGEPGSTITWPRREFAPEDELIFARDSGLLVPLADPFWHQHLLESEWDTLERMSMPVWGVLDGETCISWMVSTPFRNRLVFGEQEGGPGLTVTFSHGFHAKSPEREITIRVTADSGDPSPVTPGFRYREWRDATEGVTTLARKATTVPQVNRLLGAPHVYLWGNAPMTEFDMDARAWKPFAADLIARAGEEDSPAARIREAFTDEQWDAVLECASAEWPYAYLKRQIAAGLSAALATPIFGAAKELEGPELVRHQAPLLAAAFPGAFRPPEEWGSGVSMKMIGALEGLGLERLRLCLEGWEGIQARPWVAAAADDLGWLYGTYDSYHSIHDPGTAGTGATWPTAQMTAELWENGGIVREDGTYERGFQGKGRKVNPLAARGYYEERTSEVLDSVPFNYYFIDCDAAGEVYDDYAKAHGNALEEDAAERTRRLGWLAREKGLVVGSEGGNVYAIEGVHILEGQLGPFFGWENPALRDPDSPYFRGRYYPPDRPEIFFQPSRLTEEHRRLYYDPAVRIPLFQAAFHDAAVTTHHWSNGRGKYPEVTRNVELMEILWMSPPLVHLNYATVEERGRDLLTHMETWGPLHRDLGFARMAGFRHATPDRMVQETSWEDGTRIMVNFGERDFERDGVAVEAGGITVRR